MTIFHFADVALHYIVMRTLVTLAVSFFRMVEECRAVFLAEYLLRYVLNGVGGEYLVFIYFGIDVLGTAYELVVGKVGGLVGVIEVRHKMLGFEAVDYFVQLSLGDTLTMDATYYIFYCFVGLLHGYALVGFAVYDEESTLYFATD